MMGARHGVLSQSMVQQLNKTQYFRLRLYDSKCSALFYAFNDHSITCNITGIDQLCSEGGAHSKLKVVLRVS